MDLEQINKEIESLTNKGDVSDGYHTFDELYEHRMQLFALIINTPQYNKKAWKSKLHADGTMYDDYFIVGITLDNKESYTYHYHIKYWDLFGCKVVERAPKYDGHLPSDYNRLHKMNRDGYAKLIRKNKIKLPVVMDLMEPHMDKDTKFPSLINDTPVS